MPGHLCIHGHFYQPPRDNPWLDAVPVQPSAAPFHDWNARIHDECYRPNIAARVLDPRGRVQAIIDNYSWISFDFGPTLMRWLDRYAPDTHAAIVQADRRAVARWGAGVAMAQGYNHTILPLCSPRDLQTQVRWGLADFAHRFGRPADGLWLPECAVDVPTLEALAAEGVRFTVLAPQQIAGVRDPDGTWHGTPHGPDPRRPYRIGLPSGRSIAVFVYDGPLSQAVAFDRLLDNGEALYRRLRDQAHHDGQLAHIATDGESYGHHHKHGEMALGWALHRGRSEGRLLPYAAFLDRHPPTWSASIQEPSSWSCAHGVERWRSDCGCRAGGPETSQAWRAPLREALDHLRDALDPHFERAALEFFDDPWAARDAYVQVLLEPDRWPEWIATHARELPDPDGAVRARELLELQRHRQLMYTSCGWFFDDLAGLEPVQDLAYARRAIDLAARLWPEIDFLSSFRADLARARSNDPSAGTGADLLASRIEPERFDAVRAAAHHALVRTGAPGADWRCYHVEDVAQRRVALPEGQLLLRRVRVTEGTTTRRTSVLTASLLGPDRAWGAAHPDDGRSLDEVLDSLLPAPTARVHASWAHVIDGFDALRNFDRHRVAQAALLELQAHAVAMGQTWRTFAGALPLPNGDGHPLLGFAARANAREQLRAALASPEPASEDLPDLARDVGALNTLADAASAGLRRLVHALSPDDPATLHALVRRVRLLHQMGLDIPLFDAENAVATLLADPATRAPAWRIVRREVEGALRLVAALPDAETA